MVRYVYWEVSGGFLGYIEDYPDYWTQGDTKEDLETNLGSLLSDMKSGDIPYIRKVGQLQLA